jgi:hypothetical protein
MEKKSVTRFGKLNNSLNKFSKMAYHLASDIYTHPSYTS